MSSPSYVAVDCHPSTVQYNVEFRSYNDDAWYSVAVVLESEVLRVKYQGFSDEHDNEFDVKGFSSLEQLSEFEGRFRHVSDQLQDNECDTIVEGMTVCASFVFEDNDVRFYDANVDGVKHEEHTLEKGQEVCLCTFVLLWLHGPNAGNITTARVDNICKVRHFMELNPVVASFLIMARKRIEVTSSDSGSISNRVTGMEVVQYSNKSSKSRCRLGFLEGLSKETRCIEWSYAKVCSSEEAEKIVSQLRRLEDSDLGAKENPCMILLGNLDKELAPSTIAEFLLGQTSVLPKVYIYPKMPWETYTTAAIILDSGNSEKKFEKLRAFLCDPNCIIMSSTGRPWAVLKEVVGFEGIKAAIGTLPLFKNVYQKESSGMSKNLKVVYSGTQEFEKASRLRKLYVAFADHQIRLHGRLSLEENLILWR
ncbi:hypothetical protein L6164_031614 [Bauhinia variegata]|uniref:Uncharacterized protein n=1 Tax=Bauhinia variegata TaxID=167791 RepID=A0ACB9LFZ8_BAUVA|nr:hypothetical protein L6164_031614 [Bauhinia variegata]